MDLSLAAPLAAQKAVPAPLMPSKWTQCQQGRRSLRQGLKWSMNCMPTILPQHWLME
jgi:hypothetical protein